MNRSEVVGIDLGTTTTLLSVYSAERGAEVMENDQGKLLTPSVVAFDKRDLNLPPDQPRRTRLGHIAEEVPGNNYVVIKDAKRIIGKKLYDEDVSKIRSCFTYPLIADTAGSAVIQIPIGDAHGTYYNIYPQVVSAEILSYMSSCYKKKFRETTQLRAVVTIPAVFKETQRAATYEAARIAKIDILQLVSEPTAAAVQYLCGGEPVMRDVDKNGRFLVFDLGGGTLDVSIVESSDDGKSILVKAVDGDPLLGGRDFDEILAKHIAPILLDKYDINMEIKLTEAAKERPLKERAKKAFALECRRIKEALSNNVEAELNVGIFNFWKHELPDEEVEITRTDFIQELLDSQMEERIVLPITKALEKSGFSKDQLSGIMMAGGGCRMPIIRDWLTKYFGPDIPIYQARNVDHVVSQGAAVMGHNITITENNEAVNASNGEEVSPTTPIRIVESLNYSLGIRTIGDTMGWILTQGTPLPAKATKTFTNPSDFQVSVEIVVKQGASEIAKDNTTLYETSLVITPLPKYTNQLLVTFEMDNSQMLSLQAYDTSIPDNVLAYTVPLPGRIDEQNIERLASGNISVARDLNPIEAKLQELTSHFYKTATAVQGMSNVVKRKAHERPLELVQSFVLGARGDNIQLADIERNEATLRAVDALIQPASPSTLPAPLPHVQSTASTFSTALPLHLPPPLSSSSSPGLRRASRPLSLQMQLPPFKLPSPSSSPSSSPTVTRTTSRSPALSRSPPNPSPSTSPSPAPLP